MNFKLGRLAACAVLALTTAAIAAPQAMADQGSHICGNHVDYPKGLPTVYYGNCSIYKILVKVDTKQSRDFYVCTHPKTDTYIGPTSAVRKATFVRYHDC
ncbi:hypothetical protein SAMN05421504_101800 [Amycolatopsis xylanica]|uniref:Secreted protein n=1 Tax=Amycolatopsis xylanica TaxID=589385 RepID=A0A1H2U846_9PSEU|nr:hypothetical protein [Amycolatopsis xylanica]SDW51789.1 hypothetical protein SAMN05421504_101800 [Amycolatopsis xylanica]